MISSRRQFLYVAKGWTLGWAVTALVPGAAAGQTFTATAISQAAQQARREVGRLSRRADNLLRLTVADGLERGGAAVRRFRADQMNLARDLAAIFNGGVSEDDWLLIVPTAELDLVLAMQPLVVRIAPRLNEVEASIKDPLPKLEGLAGEDPEDVVLMLVLASLGARTDDPALRASLKDDNALASALRDTTTSLKTRRYGLAALELERLINFVVLPRNVEAMSDGSRDRQRAIYQMLVLWFVPFVGWSFFIARVLAAIYQARDVHLPTLR